MRVPIKHLHRAFPELDGYTDEQCARFVRAARGTSVRRVVRAFVIGCFFLFAAVGCFAVTIVAYTNIVLNPKAHSSGGGSGAWYGVVLQAVMVLISCSLPPLCATLLRDFFLIRRIRRVLRTRGVCSECGYSLVGLAVGTDLRVLCPECGTTTEVDQSLGELVTDETGRRRFHPGEPQHRAHRFRTLQQTRRLRRRLWLAAALFVGIPLIAGLAYEGFIRWQAKVAARDRNVVQVLNEAMMAKSGTNERRGAANAWDAFERANLQRLYHDGDTWMISPGSQIVWPNFSLIYDQSTLSYPGRDDESKDRDLRSLALALQLIEEYRAIGLYSTLDEMAASPVALRLIEQQGRPLLQMMSPHLPDVRRLASISAARARLACRSDDLQEFASALDSGLALVRLLDHQLLRADQISAASIEFIVLERAMEMLSGPVNAKWVETIHEIMLRQLPSEPTLDWLDYDRAVRLDMIAWIFSDPSKSRFGRWSSFLKHYQGFRSGRSYPLGTYGGNVSAINRVYNGMLSYARTPIPERDVKSFEAEFSRGKLLLPDVYASPPLMELNIHERRVVMRRAAQAMVALERFRLATGSYPDDLADLVPHFIEEVPIDPWSDASLGYRRIDPSEDPHGRGYLLYSVGSDLTDNGGAPPDRRYRGTVLSTSPSQRRGGVDYIFNEPHFSESSGSTNRDE